MNHAPQKRPRAHHHGARRVHVPRVCDHAANPAIFNDQPVDQRLDNIEIGLGFEHRPHVQPVFELVRLGAVAPNRRSFAAVEHAKLNARGIDAVSHFATQCIDFTHQMPLGNTADGRIARHQRNAVALRRHQGRGASHTRRRQGCLAPGVTGANDQHIIAAS